MMKSVTNNRRLTLTTALILGIFLCLGGIPAWCVEQPVNSQTICDAVEDELLVDSAVESYQIDAFCNEGIVTLEGVVNNILSKKRAGRIAETVKGVRAVVNRIRVSPPVPRSDLEIKDDVLNSLFQDPATDSYDIDVTVENNVVTLTGTVQSWRERALCQKVAMGVDGVTALVNDIDVEYKIERPDREIKKEIEQTLKWDVLVDHALIRVAVDDGKVRLSGTVGSAAEKRIAVDGAYLAGVVSVDSTDLKVKKWARDSELRKSKYVEKSDREIYQAIKGALSYDPRVFHFNVKPEVSDGIVTLRGTVDNLKAKRSAAQDARNTVGVLAVKNRIKVRSNARVTDKKVTDWIKRALSRDPYVEPSQLSLLSKNGIVDLYGSVDSYFEKIHAEDVASRVRGVVAVDNNIVVKDDSVSYYYSPYVDSRYVYDFDWYHHVPRHTHKSDRKVKEDIEREIFWSPFVDSDDVRISVENGIVTLTGKVNSSLEYYAATENAYEGGATVVDNDLIIEAQ